MRLEEKHLAQLAAVVSTGGVTEAAKLLGVSQPAVSRTIAMLEARLGERLFIRGKRPLVPTEVGRQLALQGQVILDAGRKAAEALDMFRQGMSGSVRVGGVPFFLDAIISRMIGQFQLSHPDILVEQSYCNLPDAQAGLRAGHLDIAICPLGLVEAGTELRFTELLPGRNVVAARSVHPLFRRKIVTTDDLLQYPWIGPLPGSPLLADLHSILLSIGMSEVNVRYSGGSLMSVLNYMEETDALTVLPQSVLFAFRQTKKFRTVPIKIPQPDRSLGILALRQAPTLPAVARFETFLQAAFLDLRSIILRHENAVIWSG